MRIIIKAICKDCHKKRIFVLRSIGDCGTHIHVNIACQRCGLHESDWITKEQWQEFICLAKELECEQKKKKVPRKNPKKR